MTTLKAFKESLTAGQRMRLVKAERMHEGAWINDAAHKQLGVLREVAEKRSKDIVFRVLEGEQAGRLGYLAWPKAGEFEVLPDGFTTTSLDYACRLTYRFETAN